MKDFANYTVPLFFSEFGCNAKRPRPFSEIEGNLLYRDVVCVFWWVGIQVLEEASNYGLVELKATASPPTTTLTI